MIKKLGLLALLILVLSGCGGIDNAVEIRTSFWSNDNSNITIEKGYQFKDFQKVYKDDECTITIKFNKKVEVK